jgi:hypothetical protein
MEQSIKILADNVTLLRKQKDQPLELDIYKDHSVLSIQKIPVKKSQKHKVTYRYIVRHKFIYNDAQQETTIGYKSLKKALEYSHIIFHTRNTYMRKHKYKLYL